jgi:putative ABC transport system substrate-binding protein
VKRRDFIALLGGAAAWPLAARAQQAKRIGLMLIGAANEARQPYVAAFAAQLRKLGWIEGQNIYSEYRWNEGSAGLARTHAAELVTLGVDVILASTTLNLTALQRLSPTIPIVFIQVSDPVTQGFILSMAHPGGNITGFTNFEFTIGGKLVDLLKQLVPGISRVGVMFDPENSPQTKFFLNSIETAAQAFGLAVIAISIPVGHAAEIERAIVDFSRQPNGGLILPPGGLATLNRNRIIDAASRSRVPAIYAGTSIFSRSGGLMNYGPDLIDQFRQAGVYVDRILKGTKAGDLPVQTATKYNLGINLKAARDLGIEVPLSLLLIADEQIE